MLGCEEGMREIEQFIPTNVQAKAITTFQIPTTPASCTTNRIYLRENWHFQC